MLTQWTPREFELIINAKNLGYPASQNGAFQQVIGEFLITLNSDVLVVPGWLEKFEAEFQKNRKLGMVGVKGTPCQLDQNFMGHPGDRIDYVEGSCAMYSMKALNFTGLYDPAFRRAYCEDTDLALRIRAAGYDLALIDLPITHVGQQSTKIAVAEGQDIRGFEAYNRLLLRKRWPGFHGEVRKILLIRTTALGDVILLTPVIKALKEKYPKADVDVESAYPDVFIGNPHVRGTFLPHEASRENYQMVVNLDGAYESRQPMHIVDAYAEACGVKVTDYFTRLYPTKEDRRIAKMVVPPGADVAAIHPLLEDVVGKTLLKELDYKIRQALDARGMSFITVGREHGFTLGQLAAILERCKVFIGADSGPLHVAQAINTPTVGIFGCTDPDLIQIRNAQIYKAVTAPPLQVGCLGCHHIQKFEHPGFRCEREGEDYDRCMKMVRPEDVFEAIDTVLERNTAIFPQEGAAIEGHSSIAVVYLAWGGAGIQPLREFLDSYKRHPADQDHDLVILFKGYHRADYLEAFRILEGMDYISAAVPDVGFDIQAYLNVAKRLDHEFVCFMSSYTTIVADNWLGSLYEGIAERNVGIAGAMGSCAGVEAPGWPPVPNPHIRTTGFVMRRDLLNQLDFQIGNGKMDCYAFESGYEGLTRRVQGLGLYAVVIGKNGNIFEVHQWPGSRTWGSRDDGNLLVVDRQVLAMRGLDDQQFEEARKKIWGE